jgi:hypothetical protein
VVQALQLFLAEDAVVSDLLHFQPAMIGLKANLVEFIEIAQATARWSCDPPTSRLPPSALPDPEGSGKTCSTTVRRSQ